MNETELIDEKFAYFIIKNKDIITQRENESMKRTVIDTLKYRYRTLDSINNISSRIMLKEIENNFCVKILQYMINITWKINQ